MKNLNLHAETVIKFRAALARHGWTDEMIAAACEGDTLAQYGQVVLGHAFITILKYFIDCDGDPSVPEGYKIAKNQTSGRLQFDASKDDPLWPPIDLKSPKMDGHRILNELRGKPVHNGTVCDYRLAHPHTIPRKWIGKYIFYWGTIYTKIGYPNEEYVRFIYWNGTKCRWVDGLYCLNSLFGSFHYAALHPV